MGSVEAAREGERVGEKRRRRKKEPLGYLFLAELCEGLVCCYMVISGFTLLYFFCIRL